MSLLIIIGIIINMELYNSNTSDNQKATITLTPNPTIIESIETPYSIATPTPIIEPISTPSPTIIIPYQPKKNGTSNISTATSTINTQYVISTMMYNKTNNFTSVIIAFSFNITNMTLSCKGYNNSNPGYNFQTPKGSIFIFDNTSCEERKPIYVKYKTPFRKEKTTSMVLLSDVYERVLNFSGD